MKQIKTDRTDKKPFLYKDLCHKILGAMFTTRNTYGSQQKESVYQNGLEEELVELGISYKREVPVKILSPKTGKVMGVHRIDFIVDEKIIVETKAKTFIPEKIENQLYNYLRSTPYQVGYLINFGSSRLYYKRVILTNDRKPFLKLSVKSV